MIVPKLALASMVVGAAVCEAFVTTGSLARPTPSYKAVNLALRMQGGGDKSQACADLFSQKYLKLSHAIEIVERIGLSILMAPR